VILLGLLVALVSVEASDDPCHGRIDARPGDPPEPGASGVYRLVGDDERRAGNVAAARIAYRQALRRDPSSTLARAALDELCSSTEPVDATAPPLAAPEAATAFDQAVGLMKRGQRREAERAFEAMRGAGADPPAALLEGICAYELGDYRQARALLEEARNDPRISGASLFFLGLVALHDGESELASALLTSATVSDPSVAGAAAGLIRLAHREGRLVASALAETGYDSNVELTPDGSLIGGNAGDGYGATVVGLFARPLGVVGPYLRASGQYRQQLRLASHDLGDLGGAIGLHTEYRTHTLAAEYGYDGLTLGGERYLSAHRLLGTARLAGGDATLSLTATYGARFESFLTAATRDYSGLHHHVEGIVDWQPGRGTVLGLGYHGELESADAPSFSFREHGPAAILRIGLGGAARLFVEGRFTLRHYDVVDPVWRVERSDRYLDGALTGELDVSDHWTVRLATTDRRAMSTISELRYVKLTVALGIVYTAGVLR
jgi:tetratricopeptide (TPR) repeat protein